MFFLLNFAAMYCYLVLFKEALAHFLKTGKLIAIHLQKKSSDGYNQFPHKGKGKDNY
jgi:hypothetical protein